MKRSRSSLGNSTESVIENVDMEVMGWLIDLLRSSRIKF